MTDSFENRLKFLEAKLRRETLRIADLQRRVYALEKFQQDYDEYTETEFQKKVTKP